MSSHFGTLFGGNLKQWKQFYSRQCTLLSAVSPKFLLVALLVSRLYFLVAEKYLENCVCVSCMDLVYMLFIYWFLLDVKHVWKASDVGRKRNHQGNGQVDGIGWNTVHEICRYASERGPCSWGGSGGLVLFSEGSHLVWPSGPSVCVHSCIDKVASHFLIKAANSAVWVVYLKVVCPCKVPLVIWVRLQLFVYIS